MAHYDIRNKGEGTTQSVGSFEVNGYGLYDMAGNVWEWCLDEYDGSYYDQSTITNPLSGHENIEAVTSNYKSMSGSRVMRGGSWDDWSSPLRVAWRDYSPPEPSGDRGVNDGFRCVSSE